MNLKKLKISKEVVIALSSLGAVCFIALSVVWLTVFAPNAEPTPVSAPAASEEALVNRHPLTGEIVDVSVSELPQVFGVMVENSADAWPLSGLDQAFLVIEAPVEGGIPRFISFFASDQAAQKIGPVRSARSYYLDWNDELGAIYAHVGGSPAALDLIKYTYDTVDLNQFWFDQYFYRQNGTRYAPHNVYTDSESLIAARADLIDRGDLAGVPAYSSWLFKNDSPVSENAKSLSVDFAPGTVYDVEWRYDATTNAYVRYQAGSLMKLEDGATVTANNVVVLATDIRVIDNVTRREIKTVGEGDVLIAQDGEVYLARWKKESRTDRLRFYTTDGYEISMNAGHTWIEVVEELGQAQAE